jgi:hypothetical protein
MGTTGATAPGDGTEDGEPVVTDELSEGEPVSAETPAQEDVPDPESAHELAPAEWLAEFVDDDAADDLVVILHDTSWACDIRAEAACAPIELGRRYHRVAFDAVVGMLLARPAWGDEALWLARRLSQLDIGPRAQLAELLRTKAHDPCASATTVCGIAAALELLNQELGPDVVSALRRIATDPMTKPDLQGRAAVIVARVEPDEIADTIDLVVYGGYFAKTLDGRSISVRWRYWESTSCPGSGPLWPSTVPREPSARSPPSCSSDCVRNNVRTRGTNCRRKWRTSSWTPSHECTFSGAWRNSMAK